MVAPDRAPDRGTGTDLALENGVVGITEMPAVTR